MTDRISPDTPVYPIAVVRSLTALTDRQIRYYEQVGLLSPERSPGGRRLFSASDVETLLKIKADMRRGLRTAEIRAKLAGRGQSREVVVPSTARQHLPHYAGGESTSAAEPDVETRKAYMATRGARAGGGLHLPAPDRRRPEGHRDERQSPAQPIASPPVLLGKVQDRPAAKPKNGREKNT